MLHALQTHRLDRLFAGKARGAPAVRRHLGRCAACQRRYERLLLVEAALGDEKRAADRLWREIQVVASAPAPRRWPLPLVLAAATVMVLLLVRPSGLVPRGGQGALSPALHVFRAVGGAAEPVGERIQTGDGLLFAYSNPGAAYSHLMVFAVDEQRRVYWFYPAYQRAGEDPAAVPIARERAGVELSEVIHHAFAPGPVRLFALFLPQPLHVLAVEEAAARAYAGRSPAEDVPLGLPGARQESRLLEVAP
jgi:hypothetical protein